MPIIDTSDCKPICGQKVAMFYHKCRTELELLYRSLETDAPVPPDGKSLIIRTKGLFRDEIVRYYRVMPVSKLMYRIEVAIIWSK